MTADPSYPPGITSLREYRDWLRTLTPKQHKAEQRRIKAILLLGHERATALLEPKP